MSNEGLIFPASINASSDANTLDDYEEGTWTPGANGNWSTNPSDIDCNYVKVGKACKLQGYWVAKPSGSGTVAVNTDGLPFSATNPQGICVTTNNSSIATASHFHGQRFEGTNDEMIWNAKGQTNAGWFIMANYIT